MKTNSFLIGHKELLLVWTSESMFIFLWPLNTLASSLGIGWSKGPRVPGHGERLSTCLRNGPGSWFSSHLAVGVGRNGLQLLIVFGTLCVILEEIKGT